MVSSSAFGEGRLGSEGMWQDVGGSSGSNAATGAQTDLPGRAENSPQQREHRKMRYSFKKKWRWENWVICCLIMFLLAIIVFPLAYAIIISFCKYDLATSKAKVEWIGLGNYVGLAQDPRFLQSLLRSLYFVSLSVFFTFAIGLGIALLLNRNIRGRSLFFTCLLIPMVIAPIIIGLAFRFMYNFDYGIIPYLVELFGLPKEEILGNPSYSLNAIILVDIWQWTPFSMAVLLAGLESIPREFTEAAKVDGASKPQAFRYITLPSLRPYIGVVLLIRIMDSFRAFDKLFVMTRGGPGLSTETLALYSWEVGFAWFQMGKASAMGLLMLVLIIVIGEIMMKYFKPNI